MARSDWVPGVQIHHFENKYNAEIRNGTYCCCDDAFLPCYENVANLTSCAPRCETYFIVYVSDCPYSNTCLVTKPYQLKNCSISPLNQLELHIPFIESELSNQVRIHSITYWSNVNVMNFNANNNLYPGNVFKLVEK